MSASKSQGASNGAARHKPSPLQDLPADNPARSLQQIEAPEDPADVLTPDTLLPDEGLNPLLAASSGPLDMALRTVDIDDIGAGTGLDEAELAELDPVGAATADAQLVKAVRHATGRNFFEPAEAAMWREAAAADARQSAAMAALDPAGEDDDPAQGDGEAVVVSLPAHRQRALSLQTDEREAAAAYDHHIGAYLQFLSDELQRDGFELRRDHRALPRAFHYPRSRYEAAHAALARLPDLWNWIP